MEEPRNRREPAEVGPEDWLALVEKRGDLELGGISRDRRLRGKSSFKSSSKITDAALCLVRLFNKRGLWGDDSLSHPLWCWHCGMLRFFI